MDTEHKFNPGDLVRFDDPVTDKIYAGVVERFHGNRIYMVTTEEGVRRWAYEKELTYA